MSAAEVTAPRQAETGAAVAGARGLYVLAIVELVWHLIFALGIRFLPSEVMHRLPLVVEGTGLILSLVLVVLARTFAAGRRGTAAEGPSWALVTAAGFGAFIDAVSVAEQLLPSSGIGSLAPVLGALQLIVFVTVETTRWLAVARTRAGAVRGTVMYFVLLAMTAVMWLYFLVAPFVHASFGVRDRANVFLVVGVVRLVVSVWRQVLYVLLLRRLVRDGAGTGAPATDGPLVAPQATAMRDVAIGAAWLVGAILVTALSYAAVPAAGGRYVIATGAIVYGLVRLVRGLTRLGR